MTENESRAVRADGKKEQPAKVEPRRHEQPAQRHPSGAVSNEVERVRGLIQRKDEVKAIDDDGRQPHAFSRPLPALAAPGAEFRLAQRSLGEREKAGAQRKGSEGKKQQPGREFREQGTGQANAEETRILAGRLLPKISESPHGEQAEQGHGQVSEDERAKNNECWRADVGGEAEQPAPITANLSRVQEDNPAENQREHEHGESGPRQRMDGFVPARQQPFPKYPLAQEGVRQKFRAVGPGNVGIVGARAAENQRDCRNHFRQRRMFFVEPQIELLPITHARANMRGFIERG